MSDDTLRIVAKVEDQYTGPLGKLKGELKGVSDATGKHADTWRKDWKAAREEVDKFRGVLSGFDPILSKIGVGGFAAALSVGGMVTAIAKFSSSTQQLSMLSRETGVTIDKLRAFGSLGERFGVSADAMKGSVSSFATTMFDLRRRWGEAYSSLQGMNLGKLAEDLISAPNMDAALKKAVDGIQAIPEPEVRRRVSRMLFGTDDVARIGGALGGKFSEALTEVQKQIGNLNKDTEESAKRFEQSVGRMSAAADRLKNQVLGPALGGAATLMEGMADSIETDPSDPKSRLRYLKKHRQELDGRIKGLPEGSFQRRYFENNRAGDDDEIKKLEEAIARGAERGVDRAMEKRRQEGATVQQQSFSGGSGTTGFASASLIQKAAWSGSGALSGATGPLGSRLGSGGGSGSSGSGARMAPDAPDVGGGMHGGGFGSSNQGDGNGEVATPRGSGRGNAKAARTGEMMAYAMDQLRREGVPEANLRQAAAHLVGQATMESGLDPNKSHDHGTGYGIYGARDPSPGRGRRTNMLNWLKANGYAHNSAEGQMRYMAHEAMSGRYRQTRRILMGGGSGNAVADTNAITREFESPAIVNHRAGAVQNAMRVGPTQQGPVATGDDGGVFPNGAPRVLKPKSMAGDKNVPGHVMGDSFEQTKPWSKAGDALMDRVYGRGGSASGPAGGSGGGGNGYLHIKVDGPAGTKVKHDMAGLFRETSVSHGRSQMDMGRA
ncbi:phage tail tip lysozyme [Methylobacterium gnaphalii]|uniref:Phage tail lysozyme domain-containing protein n=1 Tax=Methylobacterium gnaphalii TaxID=1010610 RepID=A0A512JIL6_9HYPH|nr:phage tail tip lysozyme [Methylobacterium gnaphalii]GEP09808.1 hypothetical protein MGN01_16530 [Methylobacterium gnaphalii]GJD67277.1 hypothetical protein MMMDOFMJ_0191 [Methylobacterium gnaphalii]GLS49838.1 hypothetical protein GCM10007885_26900 [Methylobacterium gnaphalii]